MPLLAIAWGVKPHIVQLTSGSPQSFFCSIKGKFHLKCGCWLPATALAVSLRSGLLRQSSQCVDFSFHPLLQTDVFFCLVGCVCVVLPGLHPPPGDRARVHLVALQEALFETFRGVWDAHLLSPMSCLALFQISLFLLLAKSFHFYPVLRGVTSLGLGFPRSLFPRGSVFKQLPSSGFLGRLEISSFSRWEISSTVGINVC